MVPDDLTNRSQQACGVAITVEGGKRREDSLANRHLPPKRRRNERIASLSGGWLTQELGCPG
eukprot:1534368-Karenia_brevis.AAC.1